MENWNSYKQDLILEEKILSELKQLERIDEVSIQQLAKKFGKSTGYIKNLVKKVGLPAVLAMGVGGAAQAGDMDPFATQFAAQEAGQEAGDMDEFAAMFAAQEAGQKFKTSKAGPYKIQNLMAYTGVTGPNDYEPPPDMKNLSKSAREFEYKLAQTSDKKMVVTPEVQAYYDLAVNPKVHTPEQIKLAKKLLDKSKQPLKWPPKLPTK